MSKSDTKRQNAKQAHEGLQKAREEREQRVEERTTELLRLNQQLMGEIERRAQAEESLKELLRCEQLLSDLSVRFVNVSANQIDEEIQGALKEVREFFQVDRCGLLTVSPDRQVVRVAYASYGEGIEHVSGDIDLAKLFPWSFERVIKEGQHISLSRLEDLPDEAQQDRENYAAMGIRSSLDIPLLVGESIPFVIVLNAIRQPRIWPEEYVPRLRLLGEVFVNALERTQAERTLRTSEEKFRQFFKNVPDYCYIVSPEGNILNVSNPALKTLGYEREELIGKPLATIYAPESWPKMKALFDQWKKEGEIKNEEMVILTRNGEKRTVLLNVGAVRGEDGTILHSTSVQTDITEWKQAEMEIEKQRQELIHVARVGALGQLASSIAHEINQPLTAILANAQAAQRFLSQKEPNLDELLEILKDIIDDDNRAGEVIRKMRSLMKKKEFEFEKLDINNLIRETIALVNIYAMRRNKKIRIETNLELPVLDGDRIQLQQVLLNLLTNGVDAMVERGPAAEEMVISTSKNDSNSVVIAIKDSGSGLPQKDLHRVFEPFYTTKPEGLGMGLAISRSIVEAHGGTLHAENNPDKGVTFYVTIPVKATKLT